MRIHPSFSTQSQPLLFQGQYARSMLCLLRLAHEYVLQEKGILTLSANIFADRGERGRGEVGKKKGSSYYLSWHSAFSQLQYHNNVLIHW